MGWTTTLVSLSALYARSTSQLIVIYVHVFHVVTQCRVADESGFRWSCFVNFSLINIQQRETRLYSLRAVYPAPPASHLCTPEIINRIG